MKSNYICQTNISIASITKINLNSFIEIRGKYVNRLRNIDELVNLKTVKSILIPFEPILRHVT
jgi:hypothetical protein